MADTYENKYLDGVGLTHLWTKIKDYVSANSNKYTLPVATTSILGGVKLGSDTVQTVAAASVSTTASRTYAVQKNNNDQLVVNVPWTDTLPSADAADIVYWDTAQGTQLVADLLSLFQTNSENSISRSPISYESNFFGSLLSQIRAGRKIAGIYIYNDATVSDSQLIAYLQLSLVNGNTVTFTVYNLEFANEPTYGYIVEWTNGGNIFIAKTRLATQTDLINVAANHLPLPGVGAPAANDYILTYNTSTKTTKINYIIKDSVSTSSAPIITGSDEQIPTTKTMVLYSDSRFSDYYTKEQVNNLLPTSPENVAVVIDLRSAQII